MSTSQQSSGSADAESLLKEKISVLEAELMKFRLQMERESLKESEDEIAPADQLLRSVWEKCADGMRLTDSHGTVLLVNQALCTMMHMERRQLEGKSLAAMYKEADRVHIEEAHRLRFEARTVETHFVREMTLRDDTKIWVEVTNSFLEFDDHKTLLLSIFRDVSKRKQDELKLNEYAEELAMLNATKDKFFSIIAHDLRGPINSLVSLSALAVEDFDSFPPEEVKFFLENIHKASKGIIHHLENLLQWSGINSGRMPFRPGRAELFDISEHVISMLVGNAVKKKIEIINKIRRNTLVYADENMISSVMQNLINNAIKFTGSGGCITVSAADNDKYYTVMISDTGLGMSLADIEKLFRIDVHHTTIGTGQEKGSGLGLIICRELIEKNGGTISVESKKGEGTSFSFTLKKYSEAHLSETPE